MTCCMLDSGNLAVIVSCALWMFVTVGLKDHHQRFWKKGRKFLEHEQRFGQSVDICTITYTYFSILFGTWELE